MKRRLVITIDGPGGAGKSTVARRLAEKAGYDYLDTGAIYRAIAFAYLEKGSPEEDLEGFLRTLQLHFSFTGKTSVLYEGQDISEKIRTPEMSMLASSLSQNPLIRDYSTAIQKEIGKSGGIVVEGRDAGSVVFPDAELKFYLDADAEERARRRFLELCARQPDADPAQVRAEMDKRDRNDSERAIAPLVRPEGSIYVDTTGKGIDEVVRILMTYADRVSDNGKA